MDHVVLNQYGSPFKLDDDVVITNPSHPMYKKYGKIWKIRNYNNEPKISVIFEYWNHDGEVFTCVPSDLMLC